MPPEPIRFTLDGRDTTVTVEPSASLATVLRESCTAPGVRIACARAVCGACTVLLDGVPTATCAAFAFEAEGREITTVASLQNHPIVAAFAKRAAFQCGYCTAGFLVLAKALLDRHPDPDRATIRDWLSSNICRCTGYATIIEAVEDAAAALRDKAA